MFFFFIHFVTYYDVSVLTETDLESGGIKCWGENPSGTLGIDSTVPYGTLANPVYRL